MKEDQHINNAIQKLSVKLKILDINRLLISDYNKRYLKDYVKNFYFFMPLYEQLLEKTIAKLSKPIAESSFIDYGGGCGILSYLAVELGFKNIIYNDIYDVSTKDVQVISQAINSPIHYFVTGDIHELASFVKTNNIIIDVICSFDVLEHIYNLEDWFIGLNAIPKPFSLCFMTSANSTNPYINRRLKKIHYKAEYLGSEKQKGWKERDANQSFLEIRKTIISENFSELNEDKISLLAKNTRGLFGNDILKSVQKQIKTGVFEPEIKHPTNTCDPLTGNWAEHIINVKELNNKLENEKTSVKFTNSFYSYSANKSLNFPKHMLNFFLKSFGRQSLFLSPSYTLEIDYKK